MSGKMHRFAVFLFGVVILVEANHELRHCLETAAFQIDCCRFDMSEEMASEHATIMKECAELDHKNCDFDACYAEKSGILLSNGTIDRPSAKEWIEKQFKDSGDLLGIIKEKCLLQNLNIYGPPQICEMQKFMNCVHAHSVMNCPDWEDSETCKKVQEEIEECQKIIY